MRRGRLLALALTLIACPFIRADDEALKHALALEATIQQIVEKAEGSVACILVSRSNAYSELDNQLMVGKPGVPPGKLGGFRVLIGNPQGRRNADPDLRTRELLKRLDLSAPEVVPDSYGSGVVIDAGEGLVLTNFHVVRDATKVYVRLPGKDAGSYADIHAADERSDLAVLKLIEQVNGLKALPMGDAGKAKKGQFVISIANPFAAGFRDGSPSVSWGMLSNIRRRLPGEPNEGEKRRPRLHYYPVLLQTDIRMPAGCSGGALLDLHGEWIGLTTSLAGVAGGEGAGGYAIPLDTRMKRIIDKLRKGEEVEYGFMGIAQNAPGFDGIAAWTPTNGGPAQRAGMQAGDRIVSIDGEPINEPDDLLLNIAASLAGTQVRMTVERYGQRRELRPVLVKTNWLSDGPVIAANRPAPVFGLRVDYSSVLILPGSPSTLQIVPGVVVREVQDGSPAARADLRPDRDIIAAVNGRPVESPREFYEVARQAGGRIELTVKTVQLHENSRNVRLP